MSVELWVSIGAVVVAGGSAWFARRANSIARDSNDIAERALRVAEDHGRQLIALQQQSVDVALKSERQKLLAKLDVRGGPKHSRGNLVFKVENRGQHRADDVSLSLAFDGSEVEFKGPRSVQSSTTADYNRDISAFVGVREVRDDQLVVYPELKVPLTLHYTDGEGAKRDGLLVTFPERNSLDGSVITVSRLPDS